MKEVEKETRLDTARIIGGKAVGRTMYLTFCTGVRFDDDASRIVNDEWIIAGKRDRKSAQAPLQRHFGDKSIIVEGCRSESDYYQVPFDDFISLAINRKQ